jgi:hypothetical protein
MTASTSPPAPIVDRRVAHVALVVLVLVPIVALVISAFREHWYPSGDIAQAELHVRGFFRHPPLVGAAGRIGTPEHQGSHPGPSMWVALLPVYLLLGRSANGLMVSMLVVQVVAVGAAVWVARKVGGTTLAIAVFGALVLAMHAGGTQFFVQPWNPWVPVVPFLVLLLLVTLVLDGRVAYAPWAVLVGSHCVQCHVGYAILVGGLLGAAFAAVVVRSIRDLRRGTSIARPLRFVGWSVVALALIWLPPVIDQVRRKPGNLQVLWDYFSHPNAPAVGPWRGFKAFAGEFNLAGGWVFGPRQSYEAPFWPGFVVMVALFAGSFVLAVRRRRHTLVAAHAAVGLAAVLGLVSISRVFGDFFEYTYRWVWMIAAGAAALIVTNAWREVQRAGPLSGRQLQLQRGAMIVGALAVLAAGTAITVNAATAEIPAPRDSRLIGGATDAAVGSLVPGDRYLVRWHDPYSLGGVGIGTVLELERQGVHVGVDAWLSAAALPSRVMPESSANAVLWVVTGERTIERFREDPDATLLGIYDQRTPEEQARSTELRTEIEDRLNEAGLADKVATLDAQYGLTVMVFDRDVPADVQALVAEYSNLRGPIAIFQVPPDGKPRP